MKSIIVPLVTLILLGLTSCKYDNLEVVKPGLSLKDRYAVSARAGGFSFPNKVEYLFQVKNWSGKGMSGLTNREILIQVPDSYLNNGEGREHTLENLDASEIEVYAVIAIDNSGENPISLEEMKNAAIRLVHTFGADVNAAVYSIGETTGLEQSMTSDPGELISAIEGIKQYSGSSNFVKGMNFIGNEHFDYYNKQTSVVPMIFFTDGFDDNETKHSLWDGFDRYVIGIDEGARDDVKSKFSSFGFVSFGDEALAEATIREISDRIFSLRSSFYKVEYNSTIKMKRFLTVDATLIMEGKRNDNSEQARYYRNLLMFSPNEYKFENRLFTRSNQIIFRENIIENRKEALLGFIFYNDKAVDIKVFFLDNISESRFRDYSEYVDPNTGEPKPGIELLEVNSADWEVEEVRSDPLNVETINMGIASVNYNYTEANKKKYMVIFSKNFSSWSYFDSAEINE
jgi:hypothetical protein